MFFEATQLGITFCLLAIQVLWLGCPNGYATWEPSSSLPPALVEQYEKQMTSDLTVETTPLYGHISTKVTVSHRSVQQPEAKKKKQERPCTEKEVEG
jgi:hypothetical protein